jgi:hypothetical protein
LPEKAQLSIELPANLKDTSGRALANADLFPLKTSTAPMPPLAKFSSSTFGIVERFAEPNMPAMLPVTLRHVEADLHVQGLNAGNSRVTKLKVDADEDIRRWMRIVDRFDGTSMARSEIRQLMPQALANGATPVYTPNPDNSNNAKSKDPQIDVRSLSLLNRQPGVEALNLPAADPKCSAFRLRNRASMSSSWRRRRLAARSSARHSRCTCALRCSSRISACTSSRVGRTASYG